MRRFTRLSATLPMFFLLSSCNKSRDATQKEDRVLFGAPIQNQGKIYDEPPVVRFDLKPIATPKIASTAQLYECMYQARGKTAQFRLELNYGPLEGKDFPVASAHGRFIAVSGSDDSELLQALKAALMAKVVPAKVIRANELAFDGVVLGDKLSENATGGYSDKPPGNWIMLKLFLPKDGDDGEVFLIINPVLNKGEFSMKDEDYGDFVIAELAKVL